MGTAAVSVLTCCQREDRETAAGTKVSIMQKISTEIQIFRISMYQKSLYF